MTHSIKKRPLTAYFWNFFGIAVGAFLAAIAIQIFLYPNALIDGGVVGISLILGKVVGSGYIPAFLILCNIPFIYMSFRYIRKAFVLYMLAAVLLFAFFLSILSNFEPFSGDAIEIIVIGGALLGIGAGLIIRNGGCTDGTEILAIIINRKLGFTVGQIVLFINIFIFGIYGWIFNDWHSALKSLMAYIVAFKMIDIVIAGLDETKSVLIMTSMPTKIKEVIMHELGLGLTIIPGIGGFSGEGRDILYVIVERLDLAALKGIVLQADPKAILVIENLLEISYGHMAQRLSHIRKKKKNVVTSETPS